MTKLLIDTNVILDALTERDYDYKPSQDIIRCIANGTVKGYITAKQITDIYYSLRKYVRTEEQRKAIIKTILETFEVLPTMKSDIVYCLNSKIMDLEDALLDEICAVNCLNYLITNNAKDFKEGKSIIMTPSEALSLLVL